MHDHLAVWSRFLARQAEAPPLVFLGGLRHTLKKGVSCHMHAHEAAIEIVYHPAGRGVTRLQNNRAVPFAENGVIIYAPNEMHDQAMETDGEDFCVRLGVPKGRHLPKACFAVPDVEDVAMVEDLRMLSLGHARSNVAEQAIYNLRATSILFSLIQAACSQQDEAELPGAKKHVQKAETYMREHYSRIRTLREVAEHAEIGYDHLRHAFKKQRGVSLVRHLNDVRVERARSLLVHSGLPLKQVAATCGFKDEYYFSAVFRKFTGMPPGQYRAKRG